MGKNRKKGRTPKMPHANGVDEVIQQARKKAEAAKPPLTEEERLTIEEARKLLAEKEEILREAREQRDSLAEETDRMRADLRKIEETYAAKETTLRLNEEAQAIIDKQEALLSDARQKGAEITSEAEKQAAGIQAGAQRQAEQLLQEARTEAQRTAEELCSRAKEAAEAMLTAAREEERSVIEGKERVAQLRADAIIARANEFEERAHASAGRYEEQIRESAHKRAEEIVAAGEELLEKRKEALDQRRQVLDQRELELDWREAQFPVMAEQRAAERTAKQKETLDSQAERQAQQQAELDIRKDELDSREEELRMEKELFEKRVEDTVQTRYAAAMNKLEEMRATAGSLSKANLDLEKQVNRLAIRARRAEDQNGGEELFQKVERLDAECVRLQEAMRNFEINGITPERVREITGQRDRIQELQDQVDRLTEELDAARHQAAVCVGAEEELDEARSRMASLRETNRELLEELDKRKQVSREDMLRPLREIPPFLEKPAPEKDPQDLAEEARWLEHIRKKSEESGIIFSKHQLMAYHTSLKINEWSPMVVLSGVSGTGKSELPRQYAAHGGMRFLSLPVKPDWDSPASLFGYYNAIENRLEATELVRTLYQMQQSKQTAWSNQMLMVLLDEMNLAHPEQYFADLLSKFEEARNSGQAPRYEIVLGAGEVPEQLDIGRNVLWTGTMNEDETTKGLSDKVIDRSMLITFPCPKQLYDRTDSRIVPPELTLSFDRWKEWQATALRKEDAGLEEALAKRKELIQQINQQMSGMGRNLGHRVWQSIQNYILNYPLVIQAGHGQGELEPAVQQAFCDALAFKMMPKLRGLEVRGQNERHFEEIDRCLAMGAPELSGDFAQARCQTSEVFQWSSADFMGL